MKNPNYYIHIDRAHMNQLGDMMLTGEIDAHVVKSICRVHFPAFTEDQLNRIVQITKEYARPAMRPQNVGGLVKKRWALAFQPKTVRHLLTSMQFTDLQDIKYEHDANGLISEESIEVLDRVCNELSLEYWVDPNEVKTLLFEAGDMLRFVATFRSLIRNARHA
jgi:hypothetical protein